MAEKDAFEELNKCIDEEKIEGKVIKKGTEKITSVGTKMAYCRKIINFTRKEMADVFEINPRSLANYEKDVSPPPLTVLFLYAKYFEIPMEDFVDDFISIEEFTVKYCL
ncbi:MAG: helix-turn-helix domain-containing protein, partial [Eubacterium sp.]|nr:helix-turn-helix domain-containing protein [Eubacterium sp.]